MGELTDSTSSSRYELGQRVVLFLLTVGQTRLFSQSKDYDQHGDYVRLWLPELKDVPREFVHEPWKMNLFQQKQYNVTLGVNYPHPIVPPPRIHPNGSNPSKTAKQRKPYKGKNNRGQRYEMKSVRVGRYDLS